MINWIGVLKSKLGINHESPIDALTRIFDNTAESKDYVLVTKELWDEYKRQLRERFPAVYASYQRYGYDTFAPRLPDKRGHMRRRRTTIPCLSFRAIPIISEEYADRVWRIYGKS